MRVYHEQQLSFDLKGAHIAFHQVDEAPNKLAPNEFWVCSGKNDDLIVSSQANSFTISQSNFRRWLMAWSGCSSRNNTSSSKLHRAIKRFVATVVDAKLVATGKHQALTTFLGREEARELERVWRTPHMLPRVVLGLKDFSDYETCQLIIHERGRIVAESWGCSGGHDLSFSKTSAKNFNKIFNFVRKSKSKLFDQSSALLEDVQVVGNFLAREFSFQNHSALLFLSRNGFLPPSEDEQRSFGILADMISPYLERLLAKEHANEKLSQLIMLLDNLPLPLEIRDPTGGLIFQNKSFKSIEDIVDSNSQLLPLHFGNTLNVLETKKNNFDIDHHRRVSLLGELLNTLQHELNNPLFGLHLGALDMADETDGDISQSFNDIATNATRSQTIIKNFSQLYTSSKKDSVIPLATFLDEVFILTKSEIRGISKDIIFEGFDDVNSFKLKINPVSLSQILFNLIINAGQAIKSMAKDDFSILRRSKITLRVSLNDDVLRFSVEDNGPGLSPEFIANQLKPFFTTKTQGTGLGLTISQGLLEAIGSHLEIGDNGSNPGATFAFNLKINT